jgi:hypothetical protein
LDICSKINPANKQQKKKALSFSRLRYHFVTKLMMVARCSNKNNTGWSQQVASGDINLGLINLVTR